MAVKLITKEDRVKITLETDKGEDKTIFVLAPLLFKDKLKLMKLLEKTKDNVVDIDDTAIDLLVNSVVEIQGLDGEQTIEEVTKGVIESLPLPVIIELLGKVVEFNFLLEDGKKK